MSEIKMRDVKKNIFEKIKIEKVKELYFLCNYSNGSVVYIEKKYLEELIRFIETGIIGQLSDEVSFYLEECGFFDEAEKKIGQAYLHVTDRCNMNCICAINPV